MLPKFRIVKYRNWYYAAWQEDGSIRRQALRTQNREAAEQVLRSFAAEYEIADRPEIITVEYVWNGYRETLKGKPSFQTMGFEGRAVLPFFGNMAVEAISEDDCADYQKRRRIAGRKDGTIWTELGRLRSALKWAEKRNLIVKAPTIYRPPMSPPRDLRLTREEAARFLAACTMQHVRIFVILAMTTGARSGALLTLTWDRVDFNGQLIDFADPARPKTKKGRPVVPINRTLMAALQEGRRGALTPYVIEWNGKPVKEVKHSLAAAGRRCGLSWVTAHVLRHSCASWLAESGVPMAEIAQFLGHSDSRITERVYAKMSPSYLQKAAEALNICSNQLNLAHTTTQLKKGS
jgi:integrase